MPSQADTPHHGCKAAWSRIREVDGFAMCMFTLVPRAGAGLLLLFASFVELRLNSPATAASRDSQPVTFRLTQVPEADEHEMNVCDAGQIGTHG